MEMQHDNREIQNQFDFATLAFKGKRFDEAERIYNELVQQTNSAPAWCGIGLTKLSKVYDGTATVEEAMFCFEKAKKADVSQSAQIDLLLVQNGLELIKDLCEAYFKAYGREKEANMKMWTGIATVAGSAMFGTTKNANLYQQLTATAGTIYGTMTIDKALAGKQDAKDAQAWVKNLISKIKAGVLLTISNTSESAKQFIIAADGMERRVTELVILDKVNRQNSNQKAIAILTSFGGGQYFMTGRPIKGVIYFMTAGMFVIGALIDIYKILTNQFKDKQGNVVFSNDQNGTKRLD